jgi:hypothetical protein
LCVASEVDELLEKLRTIDLKYYNNLDEKVITMTNKEIVKQVVRDTLRRSEEFFQKGTPEDSAYGIVYRKIAKELLDAL